MASSITITNIDTPNNPLWHFGQEIACYINWSGYQCWVVGGPVRDLMLGLEPNDLDMMTPMSTKGMRLLPIPDCTVVGTGEQYGTMTFIRGDLKVEITTCREDFGNQDAGDNRKDVNPVFIHKNWFGPIADVRRRDFTINGMFMDPFWGNVYDWVGGFEDILLSNLCFIGDPIERCREDALRVFRYIRFATRLLSQGFKIDPVIFDVVEDHIVQARLEMLSAERVRDEFIKTITVESGHAAAWAMTMYLELGLIDMWFHEMKSMVDQDQNIYHTEDVWGHTLLAVEYSKPDLIHRLFALWHDLAKPHTAEFRTDDYGYSFHDHAPAGARIAKDIALRLKFGHKEPVYLDFLCYLIEHHMDAFVIGKTSRMLKRIGIVQFGEELGAQYVLDTAWHVGRSDYFGRAPMSDAEEKIKGGNDKLLKAYGIVQDYIQDKAHPAISVRSMAIDGHRVMELLDIEPGPEIGRILNNLLLMIQNDYIPNEKDALEQTVLSGEYHFVGDE